MNYTEKFLQHLKETIKYLIDNKITLIFGIFWLFVTIILSYVTYNTYIKPLISKHKLNKEFVNDNINNDEDILIMYFYTEWCPYCKKAKPEWNKFEEHINNIKKNIDYNIKLVIINCDEKKDIADKYDINGYPTIKLIYKEKEYDFDAKVTKDNLIKFLESIK
tara:strand:+ start:1000 stop:1488 length:489 start_codon:yes stop_codon:yes gene_type:complete